MVTKRKVAKKKTISRKAGADAPVPAAAVVPKKKGVAVKSKPKVSSKDFALGDAVVISNVLELQEKIVAAISSQNEIILDGGEVEQIDGTGLQLLVGLMKEANSSKTAVIWKSASDTLCNNAAQLGLVEILGLEKALKSE